MWNALRSLFRPFKFMLYLSSKLSSYINVFYMFLTCFSGIWSSSIENNLYKCIRYFLLENGVKIRNFKKIFLEYFSTNYLVKCPVWCLGWYLTYILVSVAPQGQKILKKWTLFLVIFIATWPALCVTLPEISNKIGPVLCVTLPPYSSVQYGMFEEHAIRFATCDMQHE